MAPVRWRSTPLLFLLVTLLAMARSVVGGEGEGEPPRTDRSHPPGQPSPPPSARMSTSTPSGSINATINRCREGCLEKHFVPDLPCSKTRACATCWSRCSSGPDERRVAPEAAPDRCQLQLAVRRLVRNESLVVANVSWSAKSPACAAGFQSQCLVTWEVAGGGLMGNLLTESSSVQLSLWSDTSYRVQVTCRSKHESVPPLVRSPPLILNTSGAIALEQRTSTTPASSSILPWPNELAEGDDDEALARELDDGPEQQHHHSHHHGTPWMVVHGDGDDDGENTLAILALFVALLLALLALLTGAALVRWRFGGASDDRLEKDVLVENELAVHGRACGS